MSDKKKEAELALIETYDIVLADGGNAAAILADNMEGLEPQFDRVKIPSGGGIAFEVPGEDGEVEPIRELIGVIVDHHPENNYYEREYDGENVPPDCSSPDAVTGYAPPESPVPWAGQHQDCKTCPLNQWGSGKDGVGKACNNEQRVFLLPPGQLLPLALKLPPTSRKPFMVYMSRLSGKMRRFSSVVTKVTLSKEKSKSGIVYSQANFGQMAVLPPDKAEEMKKFGDSLKAFTRRRPEQDGSADDAPTPDDNTPPAAAATQPPGDDAPF